MIRIITDTGSDITLRQAAAMDVEIVSLRVSFDKQPYEQLGDESFDEFYRLLAACKELPVTSQPPPADYLGLYAKARQAGDDVLVIAMSSGLSGTCQSARIAADMAEYDRIFVFDSLSAIMSQRMLVEYAVKLRAEGCTVEEIYAILNDAKDRIVLYGALDTLKYLRKGGRIPKSAEVLGTVMGIKPIVTLEEGKIAMVSKARGSAGVIAAMVKLMENNTDFDPATPVYFGYTHDDTLCRKFRRICISKFGLSGTKSCPVGGTIGTHIGTGAFAFTYLARAKGH